MFSLAKRDFATHNVLFNFVQRMGEFQPKWRKLSSVFFSWKWIELADCLQNKKYINACGLLPNYYCINEFIDSIWYSCVNKCYAMQFQHSNFYPVLWMFLQNEAIFLSAQDLCERYCLYNSQLSTHSICIIKPRLLYLHTRSIFFVIIYLQVEYNKIHEVCFLKASYFTIMAGELV